MTEPGSAGKPAPQAIWIRRASNADSPAAAKLIGELLAEVSEGDETNPEAILDSVSTALAKELR